MKWYWTGKSATIALIILFAVLILAVLFTSFMW